MSYDFCIEAMDLQPPVALPASLEDLLMARPNALATIEDPSGFLHRVETFPGMQAEGDTFRYYDPRRPGTGFRAYSIHKMPTDLFYRQAVPLFSKSTTLDQLVDFENTYKQYPLQGIKIDMFGPWISLVSFFAYLHHHYPSLYVIDQQTCMVYDETSFRVFIAGNRHRHRR